MSEDRTGRPGRRDAVRVAVAALLRVGEPGDELLRGLVAQIGPVAVCELIMAVACGQTSADEVVAALTETLADTRDGLLGTGQMSQAIDRWSVRAAAAANDRDSDRGSDAGSAPGAGRGARTLEWGRRDLDSVAKIGGRLVIPGDEEWPETVDDLGPATPLGLWVRGAARLNLAFERSVAIVGARAASGYGTKCASDLAWDLAAEGITVVSGGAFGIDAAAHRAAVAQEKSTIAFMAGGVDRFYPAANEDLFAQILHTGAIVSETAPGMSPMRHRFLLRNRLIAASSRVSVIVEAGYRSGALNTARHARELSREVAAFPGSVYSASSTGTHRLLKNHEAQLVTCSADVIALLGEESPALLPAEALAAGRHDPVDDLDEREKICLNALSATKPLDAGTVAARAGLTMADVLAALTALDLAGLAARRDDGWVKLRTRASLP